MIHGRALHQHMYMTLRHEKGMQTARSRYARLVLRCNYTRCWYAGESNDLLLPPGFHVTYTRCHVDSELQFKPSLHRVLWKRRI